MKKVTLVLAAIIAMTSVAHADWYGRRPYRGYHHDNHSGDWVGPLVGGLLIGGMLGSLSQQRVYNEPVYNDYQPQLYCYKRYLGTDYDGYPIYRRYCEER